MVKARTWFTLCIIALGTIGATASCGGSDEGTVSSAGSGGGGVIPGGGRAGTTGRAGATGSSGSTGNVGTGLGATCASNAQCDDGLVCITPDSTELGDGGPSLGMCTLACTSTADCAAVATGSACFEVGTDKGYCFASCVQGEATVQTDKCLGRPDFACQDISETATPEAFCLPRCRADLECGDGLFCNKRSGLCSPTKGTGDPLGSPCTPGAAVGTCEGVCLRTSADGVTPITGVCTELCSGVFPCKYSGENPGGLCLGPLSADWDVGDLGYCQPSCECSGDCTYPGDVCRAWAAGEESLATTLNAPGLCYPSVMNTVELDCGEGGAGGAGGADGVGDAGMGGTTAP